MGVVGTNYWQLLLLRKKIFHIMFQNEVMNVIYRCSDVRLLTHAVRERVFHICLYIFFNLMVLNNFRQLIGYNNYLQFDIQGHPFEMSEK